jgi:2,3-bisphosphoglycerate-independent phosphoglycerate mutase
LKPAPNVAAARYPRGVEPSEVPAPPRPGTKRVLVVLAGAFDPPGERTPLVDAETPALDRMARAGRCGVVATGARSPWEGFTALLGAGESAPSLGAAEALGGGFAVGPGESAYRADFVTVGDGGLEDPFGGKVGDPEASALLDAVRAAAPRARLHRAGGHRNVVVLPCAAQFCASPWEMVGRKPTTGLPVDGPEREFFEAASKALAAHDVNAVRIDLGENPANALWPHGGGPEASVAPRAAPPGGAVLVGRGAATAAMARVLGWESSLVVGDDDLLAAAALAAVAVADFVVVRTESVLDAAVAGRDAKRDALSLADARLVAPLLAAVEERDAFVMAVAADAVIDSATRALSRGPAPFVVVGAGGRSGAAAFTESACAGGGYHVGSGAEFAALFA